MYFKPRIFISSTMGDKLQLRTDIKNEFEKHGAEVALYEKDLTPSVDLNTYRSDVLKADFVIFIIDDRYGKKTEFGISGTEEEFVLVQNNRIPFHVYLKQVRKTKNAKAFEEKLKTKGISFYYYHSEEELKEKLFSTSFTTKPQAIKDFYENDELIAITKELTETLRKNKTIDWTKRESARARMRMLIKRLLKQHRYPPEGMEDAVQTVMTQCELWTDNIMDAE